MQRIYRCQSLFISRRCNSSFIRKQIETVPTVLHKHLFGNNIPSTSATHEIPIDLPNLRGNSLQEHFWLISDEQTAVYKSLLDIAQNFQLDVPIPTEWKFEVGWTRYDRLGNIEKVPYPIEDVFFFDVETCVQDGHLPTLAVALSNEAWYSWCSDRLVKNFPVPQLASLCHMIPLGGLTKERVAIGHNVGYDRARAKEPYDKCKTYIRFMDTMSMSIPIYGMADHQVSLYEKDDADPDIRKKTGWKDTWNKRVCKNSLSSVHEHICNNSDMERKSLDKSWQSFFVKESIEEIRKEFQTLVTYCAEDNLACAQIFQKLWPEFKIRFPHPATLAGMLNVGNAYLPINRNWTQFFAHNEEVCEKKKTAGAQSVIRAAQLLLKSDDEIIDPWLWNVDWTVKNGKLYPEWYCKLFTKRKSADQSKSVDDLISGDIVMKSALVPLIFGMVFGPYPLFKTTKYGWGYLVPQVSESIDTLSTSTESSIFVPFRVSQAIVNVVKNNKLLFGDMPLPSKPKAMFGPLQFYQLPHPSGSGNVGDPLSKHFFRDIDEDVLRPTRFKDEFSVLLESLKTTRFWTNYSKRFDAEIPVWYDNISEEGMENGAIAPAIVPTGTVSRRSVHKLWVTLTNMSDDTLIGTGIKSMVQAPAGYRLVGADVDSQEQWIAGLFGDASYAKALDPADRHPGLTPFSNMMLAGSKSDSTDLHTVVAKQLHINRGQAKTLNYARLYGSGEQHAAKHLKQNGMKERDAVRIARNLFKITKGIETKWRMLRPEVCPLLDQFIEECGKKEYETVDGLYFIPSYDSIFRTMTVQFEDWIFLKAKQEDPNLTKDILICVLYDDYAKTISLYTGGYESATFNFLELQASQKELSTPVLGCRLADSLSNLPEGTPDREHFAAKYKRSVMNWLVQSSAVDFLHLLLVCMEWLCRENDIEARFVISIHDEVRYLCREENAPRVALALMLSNMYARAFISDKVGIKQLPMSVAFFSQVDCDTVLRKEVDSKCVNPDGTTAPDGVTWNIEDVIKLTLGKLK